MKTNRHFWKGSRCVALAVGVLVVGAVALNSCEQYDLDEKTPEGWGSSIYSWLDEKGNYTTTVHLINDLNYREVLAQTGSKTLFVADDAAYERFFQNNTWGVHSYADLSESQKKLLLFGSMLGNSMQLHNLSNVQGTPPIEGEAVRRYADASEYDSVAVLTAEQMPDNPYWKRYRESGVPMVCMTDKSTVPLQIFVDKLLEKKRITNADYNFLFNYKVDRQPGDASINGVQVLNPNNKCSNGFIHQMAEVVTPLPNMAEVIRQEPRASLYNSFLERFCAPYPADMKADFKIDPMLPVTSQYNYLYNAQVDTVFQKRFFSDKSQGGSEVNKTPDGGPVVGKLKFDPEWNAYYSGQADGDETVAMQRDMAVMMVPTTEALNEYWENGAGKVLQDNYHTWENVPNDVINELINNNMLSSFVSSVPSKFASITNDANDPMGVTEDAIDEVLLGCNGAVYLTNRVYSPTTYVSVVAPSKFKETMKVLGWGIEQLKYKPYLNSMNAYYSFFFPDNADMLWYIDPCSYGKKSLQLMRFRYDETKTDERDRVKGYLFNFDPLAGTLDSIGEASYDMVKNRIKDILETHIVIGNVEDGHTYYRTKGGTEIRVADVEKGVNGMTVEGSYQVNEGAPIRIKEIYDQSPQTNGKGMGNGKVYVLDGQPILGTRQTVRDILAAHTEFEQFLALMDGCDMFETKRKLGNKAAAGQNITTFNAYHYTVYVPTNESIIELQNAGKLPRLEDIANMEPTDSAAAMKKIEKFLKYHIQDNALFVGAAKDSADYETALIDPRTERFIRVTAELTDNGLTISDQACKKDKTRTPAKVLTADPRLFNLMAREYLYGNDDATTATMLETSSSAVVHLIDKPLLSD